MGNIRPFLAANKTKDGASVLHAAPRESAATRALRHLLAHFSFYEANSGILRRLVSRKIADTTRGISDGETARMRIGEREDEAEQK